MQEESVVRARMNNPVMLVPGALQPLLELANSAREVGLPPKTADLVHLRAAQINGCSYCVDMHAREAKEAGETEERLFAVAASREAPYFSDAERAALALTEAATRLADRTDPVPDGVFEEAARHYDEPTLAALIVEIAPINFWNRTTVAVRQVAGSGPA
jgi:AhpD family alkylhydroperoxidase